MQFCLQLVRRIGTTVLFAAAPFLSVGWFVACANDAAERERSSNRASPPDTLEPSAATDEDERGRGARRFLDYLKSGERTYAGVFDVTKGGNWDIDTLLAYLQPSGISMYDVNDQSDVAFAIRDVRRQLERREGKAFTTLVHLGHIYARPYPRELSFEARADTLIVGVASWYRLLFLRRSERLYLARIEYWMLEEA